MTISQCQDQPVAALEIFIICWFDVDYSPIYRWTVVGHRHEASCTCIARGMPELGNFQRIMASPRDS